MFNKIKSKKPQGQPTRGKTAPNRLRRVDNFLLLYDPHLIRRTDNEFKEAFFVDLGFGEHPGTTLESAQRFRKINPRLKVMGVEIDPQRVDAALGCCGQLTSFRLGGFNLPMQLDSNNPGKSETVRLIRAFNVLRQYEEQQVKEAHLLLAHYLLPGGLIIEGTSDPFGRFWTANIIRKSQDETIKREALVFSVNFKSTVEFEPGALQPVLPKNLIHRVITGQWIYKFFDDWKHAWNKTVSQRIPSGIQRFMLCGEDLFSRGYAVDLRKRFLSKGYLIVKDDKPDSF